MFRTITCALTALLLIASTCTAQDAPKKKKGQQSPAAAQVAQFMKSLEPAELSEEVSGKVKAMFTKASEEAAKLRKESGLTPEMWKKRTEASKKAREEGKNQKEVREAGIAAMELSDEQKKVLEEVEAKIAKVKVEIGKLLTDEQKSKLGKQLQTALKEKTKKGSKN